MAIIVYTSSAPNPQSSQIDFTIDLSNGETLPQSQQFYAAAVDTVNAGASFSYSWTLLQKPEGSVASLSGQLTATPTLNNVDAFGNYRLFCIARNTSTNETSEVSIIAAPNSAFCHARVLSETLGLEKPATGERDWTNRTNSWVDAIEGLAVTSEDHEDRIVALEAVTELNNATTTRAGKVELATAEESNEGSINGQGQTGPLVLTPNGLIEGLGGIVGTDTIESKIQDISLAYISDNRMSLADLAGVSNNLNPVAGTALVYNGTEWTSSGSGGLTFGDGTSSELITFGDTLNFVGTANKVNVSYNTSTNTFTFTLPASITSNAITASALASSRAISLSGVVTGSNTFNGTSNMDIVTSLTDNSIANAKLVNKGITFSNGSTSELINLGDTISFVGTSNEVDVSYTAASNTFTLSLPTSISANASTASDINGLSTTGIVKRTGSNTFTTTTNLADLSDVSDTLPITNRNVLQTNGTNWVSRDVTYTMNRSSNLFPYNIGGYYEGPLFEADIDAVPANDQQSIFAWYNHTGETVTISGYSVIVGSSANTTETHQFAMFTATEANFKINAYTTYLGSNGDVDSRVTTTNSAKHVATANLNFITGSGAIQVPAGSYVGVYCILITNKSGQEHRISVNLHSYIPIVKA